MLCGRLTNLNTVRLVRASVPGQLRDHGTRKARKGDVASPDTSVLPPE
jgi:hypothetical protein